MTIAGQDTGRRQAGPEVHPLVDRLAAYSWRLLVVAAAGLAVLWLVGRLRIVLIPLVIALLLSRALAAPAAALRRRRWPAALAALATLLAFLALVVGVFFLIGASVAKQMDDLGPTIGNAIGDVERWLVEEGPFEIDREDISRARGDVGKALRASLESSPGAAVSGAILVAEGLIGIVLGLIIAFFALKDGSRFLRWASGLLPAPRRELARVMAGRAWETLGGYLRGAALLGLVEGVAMAVALTLVGAELAVPVGLLTFMAAFVPFVGAIVAGIVAVLVALGTAGADGALIVLLVAVALQQLDNDLLAPVVYGRALNLHPVVVLVGIVAGSALFGLVGSLLAVPFTAVAVNVTAAARAHRSPTSPSEEAGPPAATG